MCVSGTVGRTRQARAARGGASGGARPTAKGTVQVVELPREGVERLRPLLPARAVLRARVVCRCGP